MRQAEAFGQQRDKEKLAGSPSPEDRKRDSAWGLVGGCLEIGVVHLAKPTDATEERKKKGGWEQRTRWTAWEQAEGEQVRGVVEEQAEGRVWRWRWRRCIAWRGPARYEISAVNDRAKGEG